MSAISIAVNVYSLPFPEPKRYFQCPLHDVLNCSYRLECSPCLKASCIDTCKVRVPHYVEIATQRVISMVIKDGKEYVLD